MKPCDKPMKPSPMEDAMLQKLPMYAYIPAQDVTRARRFYKEKLGFTPKADKGGGVVYEFCRSLRVFPVPDTQRWHVSRQSGFLAGRLPPWPTDR
jgi:hypothetical protein